MTTIKNLTFNKDVRFILNHGAAGRALLRGNAKMINAQMGAMSGLLGTIRAQFFQQFGFEGKFEMEPFTTDRSTVKIHAADARTTKTLKANPRWLAQFIDNISV